MAKTMKVRPKLYETRISLLNFSSLALCTVAAHDQKNEKVIKAVLFFHTRQTVGYNVHHSASYESSNLV